MITQNNANYAWERMKMKQKLMRNAECHSLVSFYPSGLTDPGSTRIYKDLQGQTRTDKKQTDVRSGRTPIQIPTRTNKDRQGFGPPGPVSLVRTDKDKQGPTR